VYQGAAAGLLTCMTPHPLATWVQMSVSPQREVIRRRRRRLAAHLLAHSLVGPKREHTPEPVTGPPPAPRIPAQRQPGGKPVTHP
jgi:hypothetical protein